MGGAERDSVRCFEPQHDEELGDDIHEVGVAQHVSAPRDLLLRRHGPCRHWHVCRVKGMAAQRAQQQRAPD